MSARFSLLTVALLALAIPGVAAFGVDTDTSFDTLPAGTIVSEVSGESGGGPVGPIKVSGVNPSLPAQNAAVIFDSANPTGGDDDLGTPNETFGGPGMGPAGEMGMPNENGVALGNLLIVAEDLVDAGGDGLVDDPDDADLIGASLNFDFSMITTPVTITEVTMESVTFLDVEDDEGLVIIKLFNSADAEIGSFSIGNIGDFVFLDDGGSNCDGIQDGAESPIAGVKVLLKNGAGDVIAMTTTDANGMYMFSELCAATYTVEIDESTLPQGVVPALCNAGADDEADNDCSPVMVTLPEDTTIDNSIDFGYCIPDPPGAEGCTPGYWKQRQHFGSWTAQYTPFSDVFEDAFPGKTLLYVLKTGGGGLNKALGRHTVAALLNTASVDVDYGIGTPTEVINAFNNVFPGSKSGYKALKKEFSGLTEAGCPLGRAE